MIDGVQARDIFLVQCLEKPVRSGFEELKALQLSMQDLAEALRGSQSVAGVVPTGGPRNHAGCLCRVPFSTPHRLWSKIRL